MSSLWTPGGERPIEPASPEPAAVAGDEPDEEALRAAFEAEMQAAREQLEQMPAAVVVAQLALQLYELAAVHLSRTPPAFDQARVAIDAMAAVVERVGSEMGENEGTLRDALSQVQMAFTQLRHEQTGSSGT